MAASAGAVGVGGIAAVIGGMLLVAGIAMFASGPFFTAQQQNDSGIFGIGASQSASATVNLVPVLGVVLVLVGAVVLVVGLKGTMHAFDRGKERDEGTRHHLTVERK